MLRVFSQRYAHLDLTIASNVEFQLYAARLFWSAETELRTCFRLGQVNAIYLLPVVGFGKFPQSSSFGIPGSCHGHMLMLPFPRRMIIDVLPT